MGVKYCNQYLCLSVHEHIWKIDVQSLPGFCCMLSVGMALSFSCCVVIFVCFLLIACHSLENPVYHNTLLIPTISTALLFLILPIMFFMCDALIDLLRSAKMCWWFCGHCSCLWCLAHRTFSTVVAKMVLYTRLIYARKSLTSELTFGRVRLLLRNFVLPCPLHILLLLLGGCVDIYWLLM